MSTWPEVELGDHVDILAGFAFKSARFSDNPDGGVRLLRGDNVAQGALRWSGAKHWTASEYEQFERYQLAEGDVVLAMDRPWIEAGLKYAYVRKSDLPCLLVQRVSRMRGLPTLDTNFLRYLIGSEAFTGHVHGIITGVNVPHISGRDIKRFCFKLPPLDTQRRIAAILGGYDDLIEVNRRRVALLEEMAQGLFEEWFVRFRFPGNESVPLIDSSDGPLPEGWRWCKLSEVANLSLGKMLDTKKNKGNLRPYLANINVRWGSLDLQNLREMRFEDRELERYGLRPGDIVMCEGGEPGRCVLWRDQIPGMMIQKALHRIRPAEGIESQYLYYALFHRGRSGGLEQYFTGATIKHLPGEQLAKVNVAVPDTSTQTRFSTIVRPILQLTDALIAQCDDLAASRDLLLPRLISGQLSVEAAERNLELAA